MLGKFYQDSGRKMATQEINLIRGGWEKLRDASYQTEEDVLTNIGDEFPAHYKFKVFLNSDHIQVVYGLPGKTIDK